MLKEKNVRAIGIVSPSFFIEKEEQFSKGLKYFEDCGIKIKFGKTVYAKEYNTTGSALQRAADINRMFSDEEVDLIIASDGGCRAIEVLEHLDYELIKANPKPICGFSDITHILLAIYAKTRNPVIHGIDVLNGFGQNDSEQKKTNIDRFWSVFLKTESQMELSKSKVLKKGAGTGVAIGGWLNAIHQLCRTDYFPEDKSIVLFWEAIEEEPNKINMMLHSMRLSGLFDRMAGMVIGQLKECEEKEYYDCIPQLEDMIIKACDGYDFPIVINAPFGHDIEKSSFRYGTEFIIDTEEII